MEKFRYIATLLHLFLIIKVNTQNGMDLIYSIRRTTHDDGRAGFHSNECCQGGDRHGTIRCNRVCELTYDAVIYPSQRGEPFEERITVGTPGTEKRVLNFDPPAVLRVHINAFEGTRVYLLLWYRRNSFRIDTGLFHRLDASTVYESDTSMFHYHKVVFTGRFFVEHDDRFRRFQFLRVWFKSFSVGSSLPTPPDCSFSSTPRCRSFLELRKHNTAYYLSESVRLYRNAKENYNLHLTTLDSNALRSLEPIFVEFGYSKNTNTPQGYYETIRIRDFRIRADEMSPEVSAATETSYMTTKYHVSFECVGFNGLQCRETFEPNDLAYYDEEVQQIRCKCGNYEPPECVKKSNNDFAFCQNDGDCIVSGVDLICQCLGSTTGFRCEIFRKSSNCLFGIENPDSTCTCDEGWTGFYCDIQTCSNNDFCNSGTCTLVNNERVCICNPSLAFGTNCENVCNPTCRAGICVDGMNGPLCKCEEGFGGTRCDIPLSESTRKSRQIHIRSLMMSLMVLICVVLIISIVALLAISFYSSRNRRSTKKKIVSETLRNFQTQLNSSSTLIPRSIS